MEHLIKMNIDISRSTSRPPPSFKKGETSFIERTSCYLVHTINGYTFWLSQSMWARWVGLNPCVIHDRLKRGRPVSEALKAKQIEEISCE